MGRSARVRASDVRLPEVGTLVAPWRVCGLPHQEVGSYRCGIGIIAGKMVACAMGAMTLVTFFMGMGGGLRRGGDVGLNREVRLVARSLGQSESGQLVLQSVDQRSEVTVKLAAVVAVDVIVGRTGGGLVRAFVSVMARMMMARVLADGGRMGDKVMTSCQMPEHISVVPDKQPHQQQRESAACRQSSPQPSAMEP